MTETIKYKGKQYRIVGEDLHPECGADKVLCLEEINPMPELSDGDWYRLSNRLHVCLGKRK